MFPAAIILFNFVQRNEKNYGIKLYGMSLQNIKLPPIVIQDLFKKSLVDLDPKQPAPQLADKPASDVSFLGKNGRKISILVHSSDSLYLPDNELDFLIGILTACRLTMDDVALINTARNSNMDYKMLESSPGAEKIFLFGPEPAVLQLPISFPHYQVQRYNNQVYLAAPALAQLLADKMEKSKLWACLKQIFSI
jgi:hypothetical protein